MISIKVTNDGSITAIGAAPIPLIETASIPLPIQNFSDIIDDLNVGTIPLEFINQPIESTENYHPTFTTDKPQEESIQDDILVTKSSSSRLILSSLLFYCHI